MTEPIPADLMPTPPGAPDLDTVQALYANGDWGKALSPTEYGAALADAGADHDPHEDVPGRVRWRITDPGGAEWAARHWAAAQAEVDAITARTTEWIEQIREAAAAEARDHLVTAAFMAQHLRRWALEQREVTGRATVHLPSAKVVTRETKPSVRPDTNPLEVIRLASWAMEAGHPEVVRYEPRVRDLAKVTSPAQRVVLDLDCGHQAVLFREVDAAPIDWEASLAGCEACTTLGEGNDAGVVSAKVERQTIDFVVIDEHGEVVPGAVVDPAHITASVARP